MIYVYVLCFCICNTYISIFNTCNVQQIRSYGSAQVYKMSSFGISGTFGVAVARHGLILWENDATRSTNLFK